MGAPNFWGLVKQGAAAGILSGGFPYARNFWYTGSLAPVFGRRADTLAQLFGGLMLPGDVLQLGPQEYAQGGLTIPVGLDNITIIGAGPRGSSFIDSPTTGVAGLNVLADGV